jgi:hypothetical protein
MTFDSLAVRDEHRAMELTQAQFDHAKRWVVTNGKVPCECGADNTYFGSRTILLPGLTNDDKADGEGIEMLALVCMACGVTRLYSAKVMGLPVP